MFKKLSIAVCVLLLGITTSMVTPAMAKEEKVVNVYFWFDYLPSSVIKDFEKETGINVVLDTFESLSVLEAKLLTGKSGYDVVVSAGAQAERLIKAGVFRKLDKSKFTNYGNLAPNILAGLAKHDPGNAYGVPYMWGTTGLAFNESLARKNLPDADLRSLDLIFKPENMSKLAKCGVAFLDEPTEVIPIALNYLGLPHHSTKIADLKKAKQLLDSVRPYIRHFNTGAIIEELATGELCVALTYNGDGGLASMRADELKNGIVLDYSIPKEGTIMWLDFLAIPADSKHPDNAHKFLNFLMRPEEISKVSNEIYYANGNAAALSYVVDEVKGDPDIYPPKKIQDKLFPDTALSSKDRRAYTRLWTNFKAKR
jgi:putrescine transport system substrate-binding protein